MKKKKIGVLTGAGISAESGLKTFRDSDGLWENYSVYEVATPMAWERDPALVIKFYRDRWLQIKKAKPNAAHLGLAKLEEDYDVVVITQNIDDLHERAGSTKTLHLHGIITQVSSSKNPDLVYEWEEKEYIKVGDLDPQGDQLRPHVVWFGEPVPALIEAAEIISTCDALCIIGTSLQVYPAANLFRYLPEDKPIFMLDPGNMSHFKPKNPYVYISKGAVEGIGELTKRIKEKL
ncbi:MAG: SIR2 family NAD-dependent protein deacylase [Luteibaculum sp.]